MIPKIIHQIWLQGRNVVPKKFHNNIKSIKELSSNYKYIMWDESSILKLLEKHKEWLSAYHKLSYLHQKVDFARYIILYIYGGIYLDIDTEQVKSFDNLLKQFGNYDLIVSYLNGDSIASYVQCQYTKCINNGIIISKKGTEIMKQIIDYVVNHTDCDEYMLKMICILYTTGPAMFTDLIKQYKYPEKIKILESHYLEPCVFNYCQTTKDTITMHKHDGSWVPDIQKRMALFYFKNVEMIYAALIIIIILTICLFIV
jgi:mannosyltransferase OCH1-like enzyme